LIPTLRSASGWLGWLSFAGAFVAFSLGATATGVLLFSLAGLGWYANHRLKLALFWDEPKPHARRLIHLDAAMAVRPTILGRQPTIGYRLASLFFQTGLIDRNRVARSGLDFEIVDPIPPVPESREAAGAFADLCAERAREIVGEAKRRNVAIHLLWSGGIDSTTACVSLIDALGGDTARLQIFETKQSRREYPLFSKRILGRTFKRHRIKSAGDAFRGDAIVVTGEYGDQLFGSAKALDQSLSRLKGPWQQGLSEMLRAQLGSELRARHAFGFLATAIRAAPVPSPNLWTALWWLNYSMKWQAVGLRMFAATRGLTLAEYQRRTFHFFGTERFQSWALANAGEGLGRDLTTYKWPARDVILKATGDKTYAAEKAKEPSLKVMIPKALAGSALAIDATGATLFQPLDLTLKQAGSATSGEGAGAGDSGDEGSGFSIEFVVDSENGGDETRPKPAGEPDFDPDREAPLWDDISDGE
jgi:hypothetical protein